MITILTNAFKITPDYYMLLILLILREKRIFLNAEDACTIKTAFLVYVFQPLAAILQRVRCW